MTKEEEEKYKKKEVEVLNNLRQAEIDDDITKQLEAMEERVQKHGRIVASKLVDQIKNISLTLPRNYQIKGV